MKKKEKEITQKQLKLFPFINKQDGYSVFACRYVCVCGGDRMKATAGEQLKEHLCLDVLTVWGSGAAAGTKKKKISLLILSTSYNSQRL